MNTLAPRYQALVSYSLLLAAILAAFSMVVRSPLAQRTDFFEALAAGRNRYSQFNETIAASARAAEEVETLRASAVELGRFLQADTEALAAAQLQQQLAHLIDSGESQLLSTSVRSGGDELLFSPITVSVELSSSVAALAEILYRLEFGQPDLLVDNLEIQNRNSSRRRADEAIEELSVRFDVTGFLYGEDA